MWATKLVNVSTIELGDTAGLKLIYYREWQCSVGGKEWLRSSLPLLQIKRFHSSLNPTGMCVHMCVCASMFKLTAGCLWPHCMTRCFQTLGCDEPWLCQNLLWAHHTQRSYIELQISADYLHDELIHHLFIRRQKIRKITISWRPMEHLQFPCFVAPTDQNPNILSSICHMTKK